MAPIVTYVLHAGKKSAAIRTHWMGAAKTAVSPVGRLPGTANYYMGNDESRWISGMPTYQRLRLSDVYPGIDVVYYGKAKQLEYDLVVAPGTDMRRLELAFDGGAPRIDAEVISCWKPAPATSSSAGPSPTRRPRESVRQSHRPCALHPGHLRPFTGAGIDPYVTWANGLGSGGYGGSSASGVATDANGNIFVAGLTTATDFPIAMPMKLLRVATRRFSPNLRRMAQPCSPPILVALAQTMPTASQWTATATST